MTRRPRLTRAQVLMRVRQQLVMHSFPRMQMALIVALTGALGLLASYGLLQAGIHSMALRYPLALGCAYAGFLGLLWLWLHTQTSDYRDVPDLAQVIPSPDGAPCPTFHAGHGGDFAGGGASASFDQAQARVMVDDASPAVQVGKLASSAAEGEELAIPLLAVVLALGLALASLYVVVVAPTLLAEVLLDGALSYTLYRNLRDLERSHWLSTAVQRTWLSFGITAVFLSVMGAAMAVYAPGAISMGDVMRHERVKGVPGKGAAQSLR